jgi:hypothetical protein
VAAVGFRFLRGSACSRQRLGRMAPLSLR